MDRGGDRETFGSPARFHKSYCLCRMCGRVSRLRPRIVPRPPVLPSLTPRTMVRGFITPLDEDAVVRTSFWPRLVLISSLALAVGCATTRQTPPSCGYLAPNADVVYVANGSGDYRTTSAALCQAVRDTGAPLCIETIMWSHGYSRLLADHLDHSNHIEEGQRLAALVAASRQTCPDRTVYLVGHSSGSTVVLAAAEASPPGSIERIVLLCRPCRRITICVPLCVRHGKGLMCSRAVATLGRWALAQESSAPRIIAGRLRPDELASLPSRRVWVMMCSMRNCGIIRGIRASPGPAIAARITELFSPDIHALTCYRC